MDVEWMELLSKLFCIWPIFQQNEIWNLELVQTFEILIQSNRIIISSQNRMKILNSINSIMNCENICLSKIIKIPFELSTNNHSLRLVSTNIAAN
jgi:hypothetical protein